MTPAPLSIPTSALLPDSPMAREEPHRAPLFGRLDMAPSAGHVGSFWHVTDWHLNAFQPADADAKDMCRTAASSASAERPGPFGHPDCDPTPEAWRQALSSLVGFHPSPDFIFAGGDWYGHVAPRFETERSVRAATTTIARMLEESFPGVPVLHTIGNHDTWPYYSQAPAWRSMERDWSDALGEEYIARNFPAEALGTWRRGGYHARSLGRLRAVVLNTNQLALGGGDEQLSWLEEELRQARQRRQTVLLMGHIPPGPSHFELDSICVAGHYYQRAGGACWDGRAQARLLALLRAYGDVVPSSLWGHHHTESVRVIGDAKDDAAAAVHTMYLSPALTPRNPPHDPAVRLYRYHRHTGQLLNYTDFSFELRQANRDGAIAWRRSSPLHAPPLNLSDLSPVSWQRALSAVLEVDSRPRARHELAVTDPFLQLISPRRCAQEVYIDSGDAAVPPLRRCKMAMMCAMLHLEDEPYARCISGGTGKPKRSLEEQTDEGEGGAAW